MQIPELSFLLTEVEKEYGRKIATSTDFESLSLMIELKTGDLVSSSTLKRLFGYVALNPTPRIATLDVLARYIGQKNFKQFCEELKTSNVYASTFFTASCVDAQDLQPGQQIEVGWQPNRIILLKYLGDSKFEVVEKLNSQLEPGDRFEVSSFVLGYPMVLSRVYRNGTFTYPYVAGRKGGINHLKVL